MPRDANIPKANQRGAKPAVNNAVQKMVLAAALLCACALAVFILLESQKDGVNAGQQAASDLKIENIPFNGTRAYEYLKDLCKIGPRPSGSQGMAAQQKLLSDHFAKLGGKVELQKFQTPHPERPETEPPVPMVNIIVHWPPETKERILLCAHYDTLPLPFRDPVDPKGAFVGANDNAGGVALLMELASEMPKLGLKLGVDFVFFDGEEFMFKPEGRFFIGSEHFARNYNPDKLSYRYRWGVLLDMIADKNLEIGPEGFSLSWADTRPLVENVWSVANKLGVKEFVPQKKHDVQDDHFMLHKLGNIPCIDIIDFDYPAWHTRNDTPDECSALSLAKVGWVLREWLKEAADGK
jgi:glutaminyl-peptide cyclotransferase